MHAHSWVQHQVHHSNISRADALNQLEGLAVAEVGKGPCACVCRTRMYLVYKPLPAQSLCYQLAVLGECITGHLGGGRAGGPAAPLHHETACL